MRVGGLNATDNWVSIREMRMKTIWFPVLRPGSSGYAIPPIGRTQSVLSDRDDFLWSVN
jgi:hypothetical protein